MDNFFNLNHNAQRVISSISIYILTFYTIKHFDILYFYDYLTPFVVIGALSIYKIFHQIRLNNNILFQISNLTLGIYLIHAGVLEVFILVLRRLKINMFDNPIIGIPVKFSITLLISILIAYIFSKIKYLNKII